MAIEITGKTNSSIPIKTPPKASGVEGEKKVAAASTEKADSVALTATTQELKKALGSSSVLPVDIDRVNAVKKALADGNYPINAERIAKKMIQFEKLLSKENSAQQ